MQITIELKCPQCQSGTIVRNGKTSNGPQNYLCKDRGCQFITDHEKIYRGCRSGRAELVKIMLVRGIGIRDISAILRISIIKVLKTLTSEIYAIQPKKKHSDHLEIDELWTYVGKKHKVRLIYAWYRESGEGCRVCMGKAGLENREKAGEKADATGNYLGYDSE